MTRDGRRLPPRKYSHATGRGCPHLLDRGFDARGFRETTPPEDMQSWLRTTDVSRHCGCQSSPSMLLLSQSSFPISITFERRADVKDDVSGKDARTISQRSNR